MRKMIRGLVYGMCLASLLFVSNAWAGEDYERVITRAYEDVLNRKPDTGGLRNYRIKMIDEGWSEQDVRNDLRSSTEAKQGDVDQIIRRAYQDLLGRDPDRAGLDNYRKMIRDKEWSEQDVRNSIRESQEYRNKH